MAFVIVCLSLVVGLILYWKVIARHMKIKSELSKIPKLPVPYYPLVGHSLSIPGFNKLVGLFHELAASKAKFATIYVGQTPQVWIIDPDIAEIVLKSSRHISKGGTYALIRPFIIDGLLTSTGKKWRKRRKMITPTFHYDILKDFLNVMNEQSSGFIDCIEQDLLDGKEVDMLRRLKGWSLDVICETAMGCKIHAQKDGGNGISGFVKAVHKYNDFIIARKFNPLLWFDFIFNRTSLGKDHNETLKTIHDFSRSIINNKMSQSQGQSLESPKRKAFLDMLIAAQTEDGKSLTVDDILEEVNTFMFAGHDTTALAVMWGIFTLGHYPEKQKKLQEELDLVFAGDQTCDVTLDHVKDLTYLDLVIKEMLRLYPIAPVIGRSLGEECVVDGVTLPKGQNVAVFIYFIHRHPNIWEDPNKFIPERFEIEARLKNKQSPYSYIPFSAGPRNCVGQRFAVQSIKVLFAKFFRRYSVRSDTPEESLKIVRGSSLNTLEKLNITVMRRNV